VIQGLYAVGECVGGVFGSQTSQDAENTWSFVSGKMIADQIYDDQTAAAAESASPSADPSAAAASSEPTASAN
jgi:succinate dehydrogenase/fumarate reductase flavoprotein subunit